MTRSGGVKFEGFVLAGGKAARFGSDKNLALYEGKPLVRKPIDALRSLGVVPRLVTREPDPYFSLDLPFVLQERPALGPLEGVRAALESSATPWCLILAGDMPGVTADTLRTLLEKTHPSRVPTHPLVCFREKNERWHPFPGAYHRSLLPRIRTLEPGSSMHRLLDMATPQPLEISEDAALRVLRNVNTPADMPHS